MHPNDIFSGDELNCYFEREDSKKYHLLSNGLKLLYCDRFGQISGLIDITSPL